MKWFFFQKNKNIASNEEAVKEVPHITLQMVLNVKFQSEL